MRKSRRSCTQRLVVFDLSKNFFQFYLPDGRTQFKTCAGGVFGIILGLLLLTYASSQFEVFWNRESYSILQKQYRNSLEELDKFNKSKRFAVAAAFSGTGEFQVPEDPEIGGIKFYIKSWANPS